MKHHPAAREEIFKIIKDQMEKNDPPMVKLTYNRLKRLKYDEEKILKLIGQCLVIEIYHVMKHKKPFNEKRYMTNLQALPASPTN